MTKNISIFILLFILPWSLHSAMTIQITAWPQLTPLFDTIYIAGNFNDWSEGNPAYRLTEENNVWSIDIEGVENQSIEFKFTRGTRAFVEGNNSGGYIPNRTATFQNNTIQTYTIAGWEDLSGIHTTTENVRILDSNFPIPQLNRSRRIWIYLPENYSETTSHYPVIYFHDGQNIFDNATSFSGEWQIDESLNMQIVSGCNDIIVVGIDNGGSARIDEYSPWVNTEYNEGGEGAAYAAFVVESLKPFIDNHFRTLTDRENTSTAGSSLGALISMFLFAEYNEVFSKAGIFSPAFWFNEEIFSHVVNNVIDANSELYFACGDSESADMVDHMDQMRDILLENNLPAAQTHTYIQEGGTHSEYWWRQYFPLMIQSMYDCTTSILETNTEEELHIFPNPVSDHIQLSGFADQPLQIQIHDSTGKEIQHAFTASDRVLDVRFLSSGIYTLICSFRNETSGERLTRSVSFIKK